MTMLMRPAAENCWFSRFKCISWRLLVLVKSWRLWRLYKRVVCYNIDDGYNRRSRDMFLQKQLPGPTVRACCVCSSYYWNKFDGNIKKQQKFKLIRLHMWIAKPFVCMFLKLHKANREGFKNCHLDRLPVSVTRDSNMRSVIYEFQIWWSWIYLFWRNVNLNNTGKERSQHLWITSIIESSRKEKTSPSSATLSHGLIRSDLTSSALRPEEVVRRILLYQNGLG